MCGELNDVEGRPRLNADEWPPCANNGNLSLCQNTSKGRKCLHQLLLRGGWKFDIQIMNFVN